MSPRPLDTSAGVLRILLGSDEPVSGQELADRLGLSRTAVWKAVARLREEGLALEAMKGRGYRLAGAPTGLSASLVSARLETDWLGRPFVFHREIDSTNRAAKEMAARGADHGTVVMADMQTAGRGRMDRQWLSPAGANLMLSIILRPDMEIASFFRLTMAAGVALSQAVDGLTGLETKLKWPNDLYCQGLKVSGILTEISGQAQGLDWAVVGVGVNVNAAPDLDTAASLAGLTGGAVNRLGILTAFLANLEEIVDQGPDPEFIRTNWLERSHTLGKKVKVLDRGREVTGLARDIDRDGALLLETEQGLQRIICGDVELG